uniref:Uncharacterized protein n=1 Tax=Rhizophora mucronata TaxID=61149 RepID=A0A2P2PXJ3_RHIMU
MLVIPTNFHYCLLNCRCIKYFSLVLQRCLLHAPLVSSIIYLYCSTSRGYSIM